MILCVVSLLRPPLTLHCACACVGVPPGVGVGVVMQIRDARVATWKRRMSTANNNAMRKTVLYVLPSQPLLLRSLSSSVVHHVSLGPHPDLDPVVVCVCGGGGGAS